MSITTAVQGASGTPATDLYNQLATVLTAAGWTHIHQQTAATMGTTAAVDVWKDPAATVASNVHTGCILYVEVDDANTRLRVRCSEKYDSAATGSPATNVKYPCPGNQSGTAQTPTANYTFSESFLTLFQTQGTSASVGWVNIPCSAAGFTYWVGATTTTALLANNSGGNSHWCYAGLQEYLAAAGGAGAVFLAGRMNATNDDVSWTFLSASSAGNARSSREPLTTTSTAGAFCFGIGHSSPQGTQADLGGSLTANHKWHTVLVASPAFLHGVASSGDWTGPRSHLARISELIVFEGITAPTIGDTLTISGVTYIILGRGTSGIAAGVPSGGGANIAARNDMF